LAPHAPHVEHARHIASLDGLRGVAISLVFLYHYFPRQHLNPISILASAGWTGVDIFFVLSGFLITGILFDTLAKPHHLRNFFARRALRLFPVYLLMLALVFAFAHRLQLPLGWKDIPFFAYAANLSPAFNAVPNFGPYLRFRHLWSLAVEEQFYLLWAPLVCLLARRSRIIKACAIGIAAALLLRIAGAHHVPTIAIYQDLFTRMDSILCGSLLALGLRGNRGERWLHRSRLHGLFATGIVITIICFALSHSLHSERFPTLTFGYLGNDLWCTALLGLTLLPGTPVHRATNLRPLRFIGRYSYGLYLWHDIPGRAFDGWIAYSQDLFHPIWLSGLFGVACLFAFCLLLAIASYHAVELPCLHLKRYFSYDRPSPEVAFPIEDDSIGLRPAEATPESWSTASPPLASP
jgi:peptidoglycan/LPS O-acetylase OafA/YrhL